MNKSVYIGVAVVLVAVGVSLYLIVCGSTPVAPRSLLQGIHDKLASGQSLHWKDGKLSAEVVHFDDEGILILDSKGEQRGVVYEKMGAETSTMFARRMRVRIIEQKILKLEMDDVVIKTEGSGTTGHAEKMSMTRPLP